VVPVSSWPPCTTASTADVATSPTFLTKPNKRIETTRLGMEHAT
jgi:hypothetical protein